MKKIILLTAILSVFITGCSSISSEEAMLSKAENTAEDFFYLLNTGNYGLAYDILSPDLQAQRNRSDFVTFISAAQSNNKINFVYKNVVIQNENLAYAHYSYFDEDDLEQKNSTVELNMINGEWRINGLKEYITKPCIVDNCAEDLTPFLIKSFIERCLDTGHPYDECKYMAERDYEQIDYNCDRSTGFKCSVLE